MPYSNNAQPQTQEQLRNSLTNPDFSSLVAEYPSELGEFYSQERGWFEFSKQESQHQHQNDQLRPTADCALTTVLLRKYLGITVDLDPRFLCPRVGNRVAYIDWINSLLPKTAATTVPATVPANAASPAKSTKSEEPAGPDYEISKSSCSSKKQTITGLDIGVGSSCIYPLLGCALYPHWKFIGTEVDGDAIEVCQKQVELNSAWLGDSYCCEEGHHTGHTGKIPRILIVQKDIHEPFFKNLFTEKSGSRRSSVCKAGGDESENPELPVHVDFTMCNPPFYESLSELDRLKGQKLTPIPGSVLKARNHELVTSGGEVCFVSRMIDESMSASASTSILASTSTSVSTASVTRATWFTSMVGRKSSLVTLVEKLKQLGITNYAIHEIVTNRQGVRATHDHPGADFASLSCFSFVADTPVTAGSAGGTRRWLLAWNFGLTRPPHAVSRVVLRSLKGLNPWPTEVSVPINLDLSLDMDLEMALNSRARYMLDSILRQLCVDTSASLETSTRTKSIGAWRLLVPGNVWSRSYRRSKAKRVKVKSNEEKEEKEATVVYSVFEITLGSTRSATTTKTTNTTKSTGTSRTLESDSPAKATNGPKATRETKGHEITLVWEYGNDHSLIESLATLLKQKMEIHTHHHPQKTV